jgi:hypothetical protein
MSLLLNIGLAIGNGQQLTVSEVVQSIQRIAGLALRTMRVVESDTELTVVAEVGNWVDFGICREQADVIDRLSSTLAQDCIAVYDERSETGRLIGPRADEWGSFNPCFFFDLSGARLAPLAQAA